MENLSVYEENEIVEALRARIDALKKLIASSKEIGFEISDYEKSLFRCENMIKQKKIWK